MSDRYVGLNQDRHGITQLGRVVLDARLFGFIPETEDCAGWDLGQMQALMDRIDAEWDQYGNLPSRLPDDLRARHAEMYARTMEEARAKGWDPELGENE